jgi:DNA-binding response OmpR family regulator
MVEGKPTAGPKADPANAEPLISTLHILVGPVQILPDQLLVVIDGERVWLTPREMEVLKALAEHAGRLLSRATIFEIVWQRPFDRGDRSVDVQIARLRSKLRRVAPGWSCIHTHQGGGYRFDPQPKAQAKRARRGSSLSDRGGGRAARRETPGDRR